MEVSTPSKAYNLCVLQWCVRLEERVLSSYVPALRLYGENNLSLTETCFYIVLCLTTYLCSLTPATITLFNDALLFSICFAKCLFFMYVR